MIKPPWLRKPQARFADTIFVRKEIAGGGLNTVCSSARCPNMGECFSAGVATFMILGDRCTRNCGFCSVDAGARLAPPDSGEPKRIALAAKRLDLKHVVITSVTRDDLPDGGAKQFATTITAIREENQSATVEVLTPDFNGDETAIDKVANARPDVFNHNVETAPRLYKKVRPSADYRQSLALLERAKSQDPEILTKSGVMLGLGETFDEVVDVLKELRSVSCDIVTIGQYLRPTLKNLEVVEYVRPEVFDELKDVGEGLGFGHVFSAPFVRSSYHAEEALR
ncbi:Lipoyl synthase [hydrothermal vent metagenome]|uniref:lipoyl synthase n=1 Tax=hydrothermal vent metagenome TaxID=652676 RepID=A0A3B1CH03_9ZZZZ